MTDVLNDANDIADQYLAQIDALLAESNDTLAFAWRKAETLEALERDAPEQLANCLAWHRRHGLSIDDVMREADEDDLYQALENELNLYLQYYLATPRETVVRVAIRLLQATVYTWIGE